MSKPSWGAAVMAGASLYACSSFNACSAAAQDVAAALPEITVTAIRDDQALQKAGSAITVVSGQEAEKSGSRSFRDVLQGVPGLTINETAGPGSTSTVFLRGAESRHTLLLIDGVRMNDPSSTGGEVDFGLLAPINIERIEVLRGPQSALYGSDAIGGVINIITRKGEGPARFTARVEGGSYGTITTSLGVSGSEKDVSYSFVLNQFRTNGFSRYALGSENDATARLAGSGRVSYRASDWLRLEGGATITQTHAEYDAGYGLTPDSASHSTSRVATLFQRAIANYEFGKVTLMTFQGRTVRSYTDVSSYQDYFSPAILNSLAKSQYVGDRLGAEAQNDLRLGAFGQLSTGVRYEREAARNAYVETLDYAFSDQSKSSQSTRSAFALYSISLFNRLHLSAGGRVDSVSTSGTFWTHRLTAAYEIQETGTKLRTSYGTGAKAPSLFQLTNFPYGNPDLKSETSRGWDVGFDQYLLDRKIRLSASYFENRLQNLITCDLPSASAVSCLYFNVAHASINGVELGAEYQSPVEAVRLRLGYTHLQTTDPDGLPLLRRPANEGRVSVAWDAAPNLVIEPVIRYVGVRDDKWFNEATGSTERVRLSAFVRIDVRADYKVNERVSVFARGENLTDRRYVEAFGFRQSGRAVYAGVQSTF